MKFLDMSKVMTKAGKKNTIKFLEIARQRIIELRNYFHIDNDIAIADHCDVLQVLVLEEIQKIRDGEAHYSLIANRELKEL